MSELSNRYQQIMKDLQTNIKDEEDKEFVMNKFQELSMMFMDVIDRLTYLTDLRIKEVETQQKEIDERMKKIQKAVDGIESDIYEDSDTYEFEIICPYCNHEFVTDINSDVSKEVECPECHNMIELDWNGEDDEECIHDCSCCGHECVAEEDTGYDDMENFEEELEDDIEHEIEMQEENSKAFKNKKMKKQNDDENDEQDDDEDM